MQLGTTHHHGLQDLLSNKIISRSNIARNLAVAIGVGTLGLASISIWAASAAHPPSISLNVFMGLLLGLFALAVCYAGITMTSARRDIASMRESSASIMTRHRKTTRFVLGAIIVEHMLFFSYVPLLLYHALGFSLSDCVIHRTCRGNSFYTWVTTRSTSSVRTQQLQWVPAIVNLSGAEVTMFSGYIASAGLSLILLSLYVYAESIRSRADVKQISLSALPNRSRLLIAMSLSSLLQLILSIVGVSVVKANWFVAPLLLGIVSFYPLFLLKRSLTKDTTLTRFQFRNITQVSLVLLFVWMYGCGSGVITALAAGLPWQTIDSVLILPSSAVVQSSLYVIFHLIFSVLAGIALYTHNSVADTVESLIKTHDIARHVEEVPHTVERPVSDLPMVIEKKISQESLDTVVVAEDGKSSIIDWGSRLCASCSANKPNTILVPCGHSVVCGGCASLLMTVPGFRCPICCVEVFDCQHNTF